MPYKSQAQQRYLESSSSPLSEAQKKEWRGATNFKRLPKRTAGVNRIKGPQKKTND